MQTMWLSPTEYVPGPSLEVEYPSFDQPATIVRCKEARGSHWISLGLRLPASAGLEEVIVCYQVVTRSPLPQTSIAELVLLETSLPGSKTVIHRERTRLTSREAACHTSVVGGKVPGAGAAVVRYRLPS